eukprot:2255022-Amphidinium_carterae.1
MHVTGPDRAISDRFVQALSGEVVMHMQADQNQAEHEPDLSKLYQWYTYAGCSLQDCHNALKWATFAGGSTADMLRNVHIALEACKRIEGIGLATWLCRVLVSVEEEECSRAQDLETFYILLGMPADILDAFASGMRLEWVETE